MYKNKTYFKKQRSLFEINMHTNSKESLMHKLAKAGLIVLDILEAQSEEKIAFKKGGLLFDILQKFSSRAPELASIVSGNSFIALVCENFFSQTLMNLSISQETAELEQSPQKDNSNDTDIVPHKHLNTITDLQKKLQTKEEEIASLYKQVDTLTLHNQKNVQSHNQYQILEKKYRALEKTHAETESLLKEKNVRIDELKQSIQNEALESLTAHKDKIKSTIKSLEQELSTLKEQKSIHLEAENTLKQKHSDFRSFLHSAIPVENGFADTLAHRIRKLNASLEIDHTILQWIEQLQKPNKKNTIPDSKYFSDLFGHFKEHKNYSEYLDEELKVLQSLI